MQNAGRGVTVRVFLVGSTAERARLRARLDGSLDVVGEFSTLAAARASLLEADAILTPSRRAADDLDALSGEPLTRREVEVLELLAEGLPNKAIAARLGISDQTVKFHVSSICGKLPATNRTDAVRRAIRRGLITV
jgi:DNA-binding NarL/FixJ family response regulator